MEARELWRRAASQLEPVALMIEEALEAEHAAGGDVWTEPDEDGRQYARRELRPIDDCRTDVVRAMMVLRTLARQPGDWQNRLRLATETNAEGEAARAETRRARAAGEPAPELTTARTRTVRTNR